DVQHPVLVALGPGLGFGDLLLDGRGELGAAAADDHANAALVDLVDLPPEGLVEEPHQVPDLRRGTAPVLGREGVDAEHLDAELLAAIHHALDRAHPGPVAEGVRPVALARPPAVAVHDDADVAGDLAAPAGQHRRRCHGVQTSITSASLRWAMESMRLVWL